MYQDWFDVKSEWQKNVDFSTLCQELLKVKQFAKLFTVPVSHPIKYKQFFLKIDKNLFFKHNFCLNLENFFFIFLLLVLQDFRWKAKMISLFWLLFANVLIQNFRHKNTWMHFVKKLWNPPKKKHLQSYVEILTLITYLQVRILLKWPIFSP